MVSYPRLIVPKARKQSHNISYLGPINGVCLRLQLEHTGAPEQKGPASPQISVIVLWCQSTRHSCQVSKL